MKKFFYQNCLLLVATVLLFGSCQKEFSSGLENPGETPVELNSKVRSNISGFVTDENDLPVLNAAVKVGMQTISTDRFGYFEAANVEVPKNAAVVTASKPGYFPGIRTYIATANKAAFVRIKLLPKANAGTISAANGGTASLPNGLQINLPANAVVNAANGSAYSGTIHVAAHWINPTAADLDRIMPGDLRAIDENNTMKLLITYGMAAVELSDGAGNKLQVAPGKKAKLSLPLPASLTGTAPASIPLWYFDETIGLWKQEGVAQKTANGYEGEVSHFSFWNCDLPIQYVQLNLTVKNSAGIPVRYANVRVTNTANNSWSTGITDSAGYVQGAVPANSQLLVEAFYNGCGTALHSQSVNVGTSNVSLGNITIANSVNMASVYGTVTNCSNAPINARVLVQIGTTYYSYLAHNGNYSLGVSLCNVPSLNISVLAEDLSVGQQSSVQQFSIVPGTNNLANIQACGVTTSQFVNLSVNGTPYSFTAPGDSLAYFNNNQSSVSIRAFRSTGTGSTNSAHLLFSNSGLAVGSSQAFIEFTTNYITEPVTYSPGGAVTITEYGAVGEFVSGTFTRTATGVAAPNTVYNITGSFRVRRFN